MLTFVPTKTYQSVVLCSPELEMGEIYHIYPGGSSTGTVIDGLYSGGSYSGGTEVTTFTVTGTVTYAGSSAIGSMGPGMPGDRFKDNPLCTIFVLILFMETCFHASIVNMGMLMLPSYLLMVEWGFLETIHCTT